MDIDDDEFWEEFNKAREAGEAKRASSLLDNMFQTRKKAKCG